MEASWQTVWIKVPLIHVLPFLMKASRRSTVKVTMTSQTLIQQLKHLLYLCQCNMQLEKSQYWIYMLYFCVCCACVLYRLSWALVV